DVQRSRVAEAGHALDVLNLAQVTHLPRARRQLPDDLVLEGPELVEIDLGLFERDPEIRRMRGFADDVGDMQQRLRWNAAAVDADAARVLLRIDERDLHAAVGGVKGCGISTRSCPNHNKLCRTAHSFNRRSGVQEARIFRRTQSPDLLDSWS